MASRISRGSRGAERVGLAVEVEAGHLGQPDARVEHRVGLAGEHLDVVAERGELAAEVAHVDTLTAAVRLAAVGQQGDAQPIRPRTPECMRLERVLIMQERGASLRGEVLGHGRAIVSAPTRSPSRTWAPPPSGSGAAGSWTPPPRWPPRAGSSRCRCGRSPMRADVALGTLYRYFPSKIHLLVSVLGLQFEQAGEALARKPIPGDTAADRVMFVLGPDHPDAAARAAPDRGADPRLRVRGRVGGPRDPRRRPARQPDAARRDARARQRRSTASSRPRRSVRSPR